MTLLALIRHGPTAWNAAGRLQGRRDVPLSPAGRKSVLSWRVPAELRGCCWVTSPLSRAVETATLLGAVGARTDPRLVEMSWGDWEGKRPADLPPAERALHERWETGGPDFRPPGGETPREVQERLSPFLAEVAAAGVSTVAVVHKGVIRAVYAAATGWDMRQPQPQRLRRSAAQLFRLGQGGAPAVERLNLALRGAARTEP